MDDKFKFPHRWVMTEISRHEGGMGDDPHVEVRPISYKGELAYAISMTGCGNTAGPVTVYKAGYEKIPLGEYSGPLSEFPY